MSAAKGKVWWGFRSGSAFKWKESTGSSLKWKERTGSSLKWCKTTTRHRTVMNMIFDLFCYRYLPVCLSMSNILAWKTGSTASTDTPVPDKRMRIITRALTLSPTFRCFVSVQPLDLFFLYVSNTPSSVAPQIPLCKGCWDWTKGPNL